MFTTEAQKNRSGEGAVDVAVYRPLLGANECFHLQARVSRIA
jgi:hypothetical protein